MIEIDKGVPKPKPGTGPKETTKYPWRKMEVGDSFFVPGKTTRTGLTTASPKDVKALGWKFSARTVEGGLRVWRVK